jgi:SAM-dependent methyltransferase
MTDAQNPPRPEDNWTRGDAYEMYVGRWSRVVANEFVRWLSVPPGGHWLDVGCGTGALSQTILRDASPVQLKGIDRSEGFLSLARSRTRDDRAQFDVGDAQDLPVEAGQYDAVVSGFMLNFVPQPAQAASEMRRAARLGGTVALYVWDYAYKMQFMRHFWNAATALDPAVYDLDEGRRSPICNPEPLEALFLAAELREVEVRPIDIETDFRDFDDYWSPFLGGQGPAPSYTMSLDDEHRTALRERIRAGLPFAIDGSIPLVARAWAVRGLR